MIFERALFSCTNIQTCHGTYAVALAVERRTLDKIVAYRSHQLQTELFKFFTNFSHQKNLFQFEAVDIFTVLDPSDYICRKILLSIFFSTDRFTMTSSKIGNFVCVSGSNYFISR